MGTRTGFAIVGAAAALVALLTFLVGGRDARPVRTADASPQAPRRPGEQRVEAVPQPERREVTRERRDEPEPPPAVEPSAPAAEEARPAGLATRIEGRVVDGEGAPVEGAELRLRAGALLAASDEDGSLEVLWTREESESTTTGPAGHGVEVIATGFARWSGNVPLEPGSTARLGTIELEPGCDLVVRVVDASGVPVEGAQVSWLSSEERPAAGETLSGMTSFLWSVNAERKGTTDADGVARLGGVTRAPGFAAARAARGAWAWSEVFRCGDAPEPIEVALESHGLRHVLAGDVRDPDGTPIAAAPVLVTGAGIRRRTETDREGGFELVLADATPVDVRAWDPEGRYRFCEAEQVFPGGEAIVLTLDVAPRVEVVVLDVAGAPVPWSSLRVAPHATRQLSPLLETGESGRAEIAVPRGPFRVTAFAPGFRTDTFGPFAPGALGEVLELALERGSFVAGRVTHEGRPVRGATVAIHRTFAPDQGVALSENAAPRAHPFAVLARSGLGGKDAETDADGRYLLVLHRDGWHTLRVGAPGFPPWVAGPFEWHRDVGVTDADVALERSGAIEGAVRLPAGSDLADVVVGVSNGFGVVYTQAPDAHGRYRFDDLQSGPWQVRSVVPPVAEEQELSAPHPRPRRDVEWQVRVTGGETARFDLDLTDPWCCTLDGRLLLDGHPAAGRTASLHLVESPSSDDDGYVLGRIELDEDGRFSFSVREPTEVELRISLVDGGYVQRLALAAGNQTWDLAVETGSLRLSGWPKDAMLLVLESLGSSGARYRRIVWNPSKEGEVLIESVPEGPARILDGESAFSLSVDDAAALARVEIVAGEEAVLSFE